MAKKTPTAAKRLSLKPRLVPWPKTGDTLFKNDSDWWHNARLDFIGKGWGSYASGYKSAADSLARKFLRNWQGNDALTYPMVFLYRHYLELCLKQIIILGKKLLDEPINIPQTILDDHQLEKLWKPCREILEKLGKKGYWPEDSAEKLDNVGKLIKEFHDKDPNSINFRYPVAKARAGRNPTLPHLNCVGVRNLRNVMQRLDSFFMGQIVGIAVFLHQ